MAKKSKKTAARKTSKKALRKPATPSKGLKKKLGKPPKSASKRKTSDKAIAKSAEFKALDFIPKGGPLGCCFITDGGNTAQIPNITRKECKDTADGAVWDWIEGDCPDQKK